MPQINMCENQAKKGNAINRSAKIDDLKVAFVLLGSLPYCLLRCENRSHCTKGDIRTSTWAMDVT